MKGIVFEDPSDYTAPKPKFLIHGISGAGKSHFGATGPKTLWLLTEPQARLAISYAKELGHAHPESRWVLVDSLPKMDSIMKRIQQNADAFEVVVLDSLEELQQICQRQILKKRGGETMELREWGIMNMILIDVCRDLRDLNTTVVVLSKTEAMNTEDGHRVRTPMIQGKQLRNMLPGFFNVVGYIYRHATEKNKYERRILFQGPEDFVVKDHPRLGSVEPANLTYLINKIRKNEEQKEDVRSAEA